MKKLRVLDLFSGDQGPRADNASGPKGRDRSGRGSRPSLASYSCSIAKRRYGGALADVQCQERDSRHTTDMREARLGTWNRSGSGSRQARASQPPSRSKPLSALDSACRTLTGFLGRSGQSSHRSNAIGLHPPCFQARTVFHTGGNVSAIARPPFSAATETSLCIPSNTTSTWRGRLHTRSRKIRSVSRYLP